MEYLLLKNLGAWGKIKWSVVLLVMRKSLLALFLPAIISSCSLSRTQYGQGFGGGFGEVETQGFLHLQSDSNAPVSASFMAPGTIEIQTGDSGIVVNKDTGNVATTALWSKNAVYVDSLPPDSLKNAADKELAKAVGYIHRANKWEMKRWFVLLGFLALALPSAGAATYFLIIGPGSVGILEALLVALIVSLIWSAVITVFFGILAIPSFLEGSADSAIRKSVKLAPENRRVEYMVRSLFMLQDRMNVKRMERQIKKAEEMAVTESDKELVKKLDRIRALFPEKRKREKRNSLWALLLVLAFLALQIL